jgi:hypothetical protein
MLWGPLAGMMVQPPHENAAMTSEAFAQLYPVPNRIKSPHGPLGQP